MARLLDKDPATYGKERDGFVRDLQHFHETRGTPFRRCPTIGGYEVDLFLLYSLVTQKGGWMKVNARNEWEELFEQLELPAKCVNSSVALKQIYIRYLDRYEKVHFLGEEADRGSDDDEESRHKRWSARALHAVPLSYNYHQHNIADASRAYNGLSESLHKPSDYDRLALSLISPLPNEQDFAVNVCTLLCNEGKHTLRLDRCPRLVDHLLAHTGVFNHRSLRDVFTEVYSKVRHHSLSRFWYDALESLDLLDLANEANFLTIGKQSAPVAVPKANLGGSASASASEGQDSEQTPPTKASGLRLKLEPTDRELFCTGRTLGTQDYIGQRVLQIAHILRNLSFTEDNVPVLASNRTFVRFLLLCVSARWNAIHQLGLDMLSNIAGELLLKDQSDRLTECLMQFVTKGLHSQDRVVIIACLEILNKLSQREANEELMLRTLERPAYAQVCSFLTLHDVMLLIYTLECLYALSSLGERACNFIVDVHGIIDTLVSLVTVEGKSYGPKACIGMKLVETVPGVVSANAVPTQPSAPATAVPAATTAVAAAATPVSSTAAPRLTTPRTLAPAPALKGSVVTVASTSTASGAAAVSAGQQQQAAHSAAVSPQQFIQQQHAHQQAIQENEQFALAWLRATYEPCGHGRVEQQELYKQYLNSCAKIGRRGVIAPLHFPRLVRSVFGGTVGPNPPKGGDPAGLHYYEGIRPRIVPLIITLPSAALQQTVQHSRAAAAAHRRAPPAKQPEPGTPPPEHQPLLGSPASPILKAQLSAPPKPTKADLKSQVQAHPHLSQALLGSSAGATKEATTTAAAAASTGSGQSNTSLIKSLLATKVNECMLPAHPHAAPSMRTTAASAACQDSGTQVAQRQQQQQQQRLLAAQANQQQPNLQTFTTVNKKVLPKPQPKTEAKSGKGSRVNGARLAEGEASACADGVSSTSTLAQYALENHVSPPVAALVGSGVNSAFRGRREPPQPPPPPLAPLSTGGGTRAKTPRMDVEDSDSTGNNSVASSTGISSSNVALSGGVSSTEDGENSLTSFEGILLNGIPHSIDIDAPCNDDSNSKDSIRNTNLSCKLNKPLMLADLLEKKVDKDPPIVNGVVGKELRIGDKGLELVDNHINKILNRDAGALVDGHNKEVSVIVSADSSDVARVRTNSGQVNNSVCSSNGDEASTDTGALPVEVKLGVKRAADEEIAETEAKRRHLQSPALTVCAANGVDSPKPESVDSNGDEGGASASVSATAANLYASLAADVLEDEDEELLEPEATPEPQAVQLVQGSPMHQVIAVGGPGQAEQQLIVTAPRQIIVSQGTSIQPAGQPMLFTTGGTGALKAATPGMARGAGPVVLSHLVSTGSAQTHTVQLVQAAGGAQPGQYVLSAGGAQGQTHYVVAQPQTALVQGQAQTVLVAQTPQQQGTPSKTIIILQPQSTPAAATHHQKVVVTPQGQQVVVTQVQRPLIQSSTVTNNIPPALVPSSTQPTSAAAASKGGPHTKGPPLLAPKERLSRPQTPVAPVEDKAVTPAPTPTPPVIRDFSNPYICEWRGCSSTRRFKSANEVYMHACEAHCPSTCAAGEELQCLWTGCDSLRRKRFSLMTHLHDRHCSPDVMKLMAARRKQLSQSGKTEIPAPAPPPPHPGYAPDAALHAIKRHALEFVNPKELQQRGPARSGAAAAVIHARAGTHPTDQDDNEGPVTKSIRLTASLILRNLVIYSNHSRRYLRHYEPHLAGVALSNVESSRTIAQLLYDMNATSTAHR